MATKKVAKKAVKKDKSFEGKGNFSANEIKVMREMLEKIIKNDKGAIILYDAETGDVRGGIRNVARYEMMPILIDLSRKIM